MKRLLSWILCICLLFGITAFAEEDAKYSFLLKVWNQSDLEISYLRFDLYRTDEYLGSIISCPEEGEDFYRCLVTMDTLEEEVGLRIEYFYGVSDLPPEEAVLQAMAGNPAEEYPLLRPGLILLCGETYPVALVKDDDVYRLVPCEEETDPASQDPETKTPTRLMMERTIEFLLHWSKDEYDEMLEMCTTEWKKGTEDPAEALLAILGDRRPMTCTTEGYTGEEEDTVREVLVRMDLRGIDKAWEHDYYFHFTLQKEEDGLWHVDPNSLLDYEIADEE